MNRELRFVFDTNTLIRAVMIRSSKPRMAFNKALDQGKILLSPQVLDELNDVLNREKLRPYLLPKERNWLWRELLGNALLVSDIPETVTDCRDPKDNKFLELALAGQAACIITGTRTCSCSTPFAESPSSRRIAFFGAPGMQGCKVEGADTRRRHCRHGLWGRRHAGRRIIPRYV